MTTTHKKLNARVLDLTSAPDNWGEMTVLQKVAWLDSQIAETEPALEDAPKDTVTITITDAMCNPMPLFVHGVGSWSLRIGETYTLPVEAVSALRNSDVKFDEV